MIGNLGYGEMILIGFLILLLFGAKRLPEIGSSLGKSIRMFKKSVKDIQEELPSQDDVYADEEESRPKPRSESHAQDSPPTRDED
jgi:sec-independent protein translocase protein TatA